MAVDLPAPFGPTKPVTWPGVTVKDSPSRATVCPNRLLRPSTTSDTQRRIQVDPKAGSRTKGPCAGGYPYNPAVTATTPARIHADRAARTLEVNWADGHRTTYDFDTLRWLCPCAFCRGEAGLPGWLDSRPTLTPEQTELRDLQLVGQYAVAPTWGDGHHTGYYTFAMLRDRCPCDECEGRRSAAGREASRPSGHLSHAAAVGAGKPHEEGQQ